MNKLKLAWKNKNDLKTSFFKKIINMCELNKIRWNMRILGIDYGDKRVGIAISDELEITAQGLETIQSNGSDKLILKRLEELVKEYKISIFVVGMPFNMNGTSGERVEKTKKFIHKLKCKFNFIKIETIDERLTTVAAHKTMNFLDVKPKNKKGIVDTISAVYILETYINQKCH